MCSIRIGETHQWAKAHFLVSAEISFPGSIQIIENMALEVDRVRAIADRVAASSGLEIVDLEFVGGGKHRMLRVFIDRPAPCQRRITPLG